MLLVHRGLSVATVSLLSAVSCSHSSVQPSPQLAISITSAPDVLLVGGSATLVAAKAATGEVVNAQWSSNNSAVASVSNAQLAGVSAGRVAITASYQGASAAVSVKVVPNYAGTYPAPPDVWGFVFKIGCTDLRAPGFCVANVADPEMFHLELAQNKDLVSARCVTDAVDGPLTGEIDDSGRLTLRGTLPSRSGGGFPGFPLQTITAWSSYLDASGAMFGTFTSQFLGRDGVANFQVTQEMRGISHGR